MFKWDSKTIEWYERAMTFSEYPAVFLPQLRQVVRGASTLIDACSGTGALALGLAPEVSKVIAVDCSGEALAHLERKARQLGLTNVVPVVARWEDCLVEPADVLVAAHPASCVTGSVEAIQRLKEVARKSVALIVPTGTQDFMFGLRSGSEPKQRVIAQDVLELLSSLGIRWHARDYEYDFSQPFDSPQEAFEFLSTYVDLPEREIWKCVETRLIRNGLSYVFPVTRRSTLIYWDWE
ncbi:MAG: methyltransferase domain-containing protein [Bacillota bacterium]